MWAFLIGLFIAGVAILAVVAVLWLAWAIISGIFSLIMSIFSDGWG